MPGSESELVYEHRDLRSVAWLMSPPMLLFAISPLSHLPLSVERGMGSVIGSLVAALVFGSLGVLPLFVRRRVQLDAASQTLAVSWVGLPLRRKWAFDHFDAMRIERKRGVRRGDRWWLYAGSESGASVCLFDGSEQATVEVAKNIEGITGWPKP